MNGEAAYRINGELVSRERFYALACDPQRSIAVEACAGAGKTWMLVSRILRALLDGCEPQDILAITFTRKAAGEMRARLMDWLDDFANAGSERCEQELLLRGMTPTQARQQAPLLQQLHERLLHAGRPVQIRTFHSWFASLLRLAPLSVLQEMDLPADHELLEDDSQAIAQAWPLFHRKVAQDQSLRQDYIDSVAQYGRSQTEKALSNALDKRVEFVLADACARVETSVEPFGKLYPAWAHLTSPALAVISAEARERWLGRARLLGAEANKTPQAAAQAVVQAFELADTEAHALQRLQSLRKAFMVADEDRLTRHLARYPAAQEAETELQPLLAAVRQHDAWQHQQRMLRLTRCLISCYAALKRERGWVDMGDVESAARRLLGDAELSGWMQQRLDTRVRHLLVDEFQDTNPLQWQALYGWLSAYAGAGAGSAESPRVFLVGDPKQSIYRFRRAEPQVFRAAQAFVVQGLDGALLSCDHTRRCAHSVIATLNAVMKGAAEDAGYQGYRDHSSESADSGEVLGLPRVLRVSQTTRADDAPDEAVWRDSLKVPRVTLEDSTATLEARQAARWIAQALANGPAKPSDIMVLSRRRDRLARVHEALTAMGIAADEPEKRELTDEPAVQDVVALLDALASPTHDLSLARALRSPIFGWDERLLTEVARRRQQLECDHNDTSWTWWAVIHQWAGNVIDGRADDMRTDDDERVLQVVRKLDRYRDWLQTRPPHDALVALYQDSDMLARYVAVTPADRRDRVVGSLRALLGQALGQEGGRYLSAYRLVRALRSGGVKAAAPAQSDAVRLLTIHGAKGLEAHTVVMLDTDAPPSRADTMAVLVEWPGAQPLPRRFIFLASEKQPPGCAALALEQEQHARSLEELNALYVALTRCANRLVISSSEPHQRGAFTSWYERLRQHLQETPAPLPAGEDRQAPDTLVPMAYLPAPPAATAESTATVATATPDASTRMGLALHRLLQWVPTPAQDWQITEEHRCSVAAEYSLDTDEAQQMADMAAAMLHGEARWVWDASTVDSWGNEVEIWLDGQPLRMDRLVRRRDTGHWWVLDFKSARHPQAQSRLREQLRGYHRALVRARPGETIRTAFINALGQLIELPMTE